MARDHSRVKISIWDNGDFTALPVNEQHAYFTLMTHKSLTRCGVTMNIPSHFEDLAADLTPAKFRAAIKGLRTARFIVIDDRTHELLVRSYVRHDGVLDRENMGKAVGTAFESVISKRIKKAIGVELARFMAERPDLPGWKGLAVTSPKAHAMASGMESGMQ
jgi:hypothetical protein